MPQVLRYRSSRYIREWVYSLAMHPVCFGRLPHYSLASRNVDLRVGWRPSMHLQGTGVARHVCQTKEYQAIQLRGHRKTDFAIYLIPTQHIGFAKLGGKHIASAQPTTFARKNRSCLQQRCHACSAASLKVVGRAASSLCLSNKFPRSSSQIFLSGNRKDAHDVGCCFPALLLHAARSCGHTIVQIYPARRSSVSW